jgi:hypothetical protein
MTLDNAHSISQKRRPKVIKILVLIFAVICVAVIAGRIWYHSNYPYGWSHCCIAQVGLGLRQYAMDHEGWLPYGEATSEASLSLLCADPVWIFSVRGKNVPLAVAKAALERTGVLSPESCGWHYIEGLREDDNPEIAVLWDKMRGLDHNGRRHSGMAHEVSLMDGSHRGVSEANWPKFIADQKVLLEKVMASRPTNSPPIRWSDVESLGPNRAHR